MPDNNIIRYTQSSRSGSGPLIAKAEDLPKMIVAREAAFSVEYGVQGKELLVKMFQAADQFIRAMELQGLTLVNFPPGSQYPPNPSIVTDEGGVPIATYSMVHDFEKAQPDERLDIQTSGAGPATFNQPRTLEDSKGFVDYRIIGVFWAPQVSIEIAKERRQIIDDEKQSRNPTTWGGGSATPNTPSIAR